MLHPSYSELITRINEDAKEPVVKSRYTLVMGTAKRARQMVDKGYMELEDHSRRPLSIAVEELYDGDIRILTEEEDAEYRERFAEKLAQEAKLLAEKEAQEAAARAAEHDRRSFRDDDDDDDDDDDEPGEPELIDDYTEADEEEKPE